MAIVGVVLLLAFVGAVIAVVLVRREASVRREWLDRLVGTAEERKSAILDYLEERTEDAEVFAAFPSIREMAHPGEGGGHGDGDAHVLTVFEAGRARWGNRTLALLGPDFSERLRAGDALESEASDLLRGTAPKSSWSALFTTKRGSRIVFAAPVAELQHGTPGGWIVLVDDAETLWTHLRREPVATRTGEVFLARRSGEELVLLSPLRHRAPGEGPLVRPLASADIAARDAVEGRQGDGEYDDYRGKRVLAAVRYLRAPGWGLVVKVDVDEALSGLVRERVWGGATVLAVGLALVALVRATRGRERLRASEERRLTDERHRSVLQQVRDAVVWIRPADGRIVEANRAAEGLWGYSRHELLSLTILDLRSPEDAGAARAQLEKARSEGALFRTRYRRRDGTVMPVEVSSRAVVLGDEEVLVSVVRDASESDAALARVLLLNRIHRAISAVDLAFVEVRDRSSVLRRTCEELVATGKFTAAWFGEPDGNGFLVPEASAGWIEGFFEEVAIPLEAGPAVRSPEATVFAEGRAVVAEDWETDPRLLSLRESGLRRGYRSSVAFPVRSGGAVHGVLSLYASEPGVFLPEAVVLLEELARELGLALDLVEAEGRRVRAEASLAESEERYRKLFEENPAPMWVFDVETLRFLDVNEAAAQLYGFSKEEFLVRTLRDIRPPEDVPIVEADVRVARTGIRTSGPWHHLRKDGRKLLVEIVTYDVAFDGRAARLTLANDVTERAKTEEKLRAFFDSGMVGAILGDVHGNVLAANDEFLRIVGYDREDLERGRLRWDAITPPEWLPIDAERIAEAKVRGICTPYEKEYVRKDGTRVPILVGYALVGEKREESVAFILDQTDRQEASARLAATTRLLEAVVTGSSAPIVTLDRHGAVTSWNPAATEVFGWSADEVVGRFPPVGPPKAEEEIRAILAGVLSGTPVTGREVRPERKDGSAINVSIAAAPLTDSEGTVTGVVAVLVDVSARVRAEEEVRRLNAELEVRVERRTEELVAKSKELEAFAYSISHDLRAPLRAIDGFSRMIEEDQAARLDDEGRRLLGVVRFNARRMAQLIDDLLAFSRAGRQDLRRSRVETGELVRSVLGEVLPEAERELSDVRIGDLPPAQADPALLRQVFVNLLSNAVKFTATRPRRRLEISGRLEAGRVVYEVADNGVGFDMRYAGKLFGVFQRLHGREFEGTGVGLALVERIVARHAGSVAARGEVDQGATFTISLPDEGVSE
jgi:PAS domain S-box-containing protein